jgi:hypothetical protein
MSDLLHCVHGLIKETCSLCVELSDDEVKSDLGVNRVLSSSTTAKPPKTDSEADHAYDMEVEADSGDDE